MTEQTEAGTNAFFALGYALLSAINPWAAVGAAFGCCFFLAMPSAATPSRRAWLGVFSWGVGFFAGVFFYSAGRPWPVEAGFVAVAASAMASVVFTALWAMVDRNSALPEWLQSILKIWRP